MYPNNLEHSQFIIGIYATISPVTEMISDPLALNLLGSVTHSRIWISACHDWVDISYRDDFYGLKTFSSGAHVLAYLVL